MEGGGGSQKTNIEGGDCLKRVGLGLFADLGGGGGGLGKKEGMVLRRGLRPQCTV